MASNTPSRRMPQEMDIGHNLIKHSMMFDFSDLIGTLRQMNRDVVQNAKAIHELTDELQQTRQSIQDMRQVLMLRIDAKEAVTDDLSRRVQKAEQMLIQEIPYSYVEKGAFNNQTVSLNERFRKAEERLTEVESGDGQRLHGVVKKIMDAHLNHWYNPIRKREKDDLERALHDTNDDLAKRVLTEINDTEDSLLVRISENNQILRSEMTVLSEEKDTQLARLRGLQQTDKSELETLIGKNDTRARKDLDAVSVKCTQRLDENNRLSLAMYHLLGVERGPAEAIYAKHARAVERSNKAAAKAAGGGGGNGTSTAHSSPRGESAKASPPPPPLAGVGDGGGGSVPTPHLLAGDDDEDPRCTLLHDTKPYLEFRRKIRKEIASCIQQQKEDDQDDFSKQLHNIHHELRKKTDVGRVLSMIQQNTDTALYDAVEQVKQRLVECEDQKVSKEEFNSAMRTKTDVKVAEGKADRAFVTTLFEYLRSKVDQTSAAGAEETAEAVRSILKTEYGLSSYAALTSTGLPSRFSTARGGTAHDSISLGSAPYTPHTGVPKLSSVVALAQSKSQHGSVCVAGNAPPRPPSSVKLMTAAAAAATALANAGGGTTPPPATQPPPPAQAGKGGPAGPLHPPPPRVNSSSTNNSAAGGGGGGAPAPVVAGPVLDDSNGEAAEEASPGPVPLSAPGPQGAEWQKAQAQAQAPGDEPTAGGSGIPPVPPARASPSASATPSPARATTPATDPTVTDKRKKIDAALHPEVDFQWASQVQHRHRGGGHGGVNPVKTRAALQQAQVNAAPPAAAAASQPPPVPLLPVPGPPMPPSKKGGGGAAARAAHHTTPDIASWAEHTTVPVKEHDEVLPPLDAPAPPRSAGGRKLSVASQQQTRAYDEYVKALTAQGDDDL